jgi:hypothetical protein
MMHDKLTKIRELVDELYDNTQPHSPTNSMLFLEINQAIDDAQKECKHYINGTDLDPFNEVQVNDIMKENRRIY